MNLVHITRYELCRDCKGCPKFSDSDFIQNPCSACPLGKWNKWDCHTMEGFGDAVEVVAKPIARTIDLIASILPQSMHTNLTNCGSCKERKEKLNKIMPLS